MKAAMVRRNVLTVVGAAAMGLAMVMPALAADPEPDTAAMSAVVNPGTLSFTSVSVGEFEATTIDGQAHSPKASLATFDVSDFRGTGVGWNVMVQADQFINAVESHTLPAGSFSMAAPTAVAKEGTTSPAPTMAAGPYDIDVPGGKQIGSAGADEGMGAYTISSAELTLELPSTIYAGSYTSTLTVTVQSAP